MPKARRKGPLNGNPPLRMGDLVTPSLKELKGAAVLEHSLMVLRLGAAAALAASA